MLKDLFISSVIITILSVAGCSGGITHEEPEEESSFYNRANPLIEHIRSKWTGGDRDDTGGLHYRHIKIAGHSWDDYGNRGDGDEQAEFVVDHFDLYIWGGAVVGEHANGQYDDFIWISPVQGPFIGSVFDSTQTAGWLDDPERNIEGYTWEDITMHFKYDWEDPWGRFFPGWNPTDDTDGDGCRDVKAPSSSARSAQCISDSEIFNFEATSDRAGWNYLKVMHEGALKMITDNLLENAGRHDYPMRGVYHDKRGMLEISDYGIQNSFTYENEITLEANRQYYRDKLKAVSVMASDYIEPAEGRMKIHFCNMGSPYHLCGKSSPSTGWVFDYIENIRLENWLLTNYPYYSNLYMNTDMRDEYLSCPLENWLEKGKGMIFCVKEINPGSSRGRLFSLATFYMINHQNAFYGYKVINCSPAEDVSVRNWNPYVEYDVGKPAVNTLGMDDYRGSSGTDRYFVWKRSSGYEILGREYIRDDGDYVLVLAKIMARGGEEGNDPERYELPGCYQSVQPDLSLGPPTREITLSNNEGAILLAASDCKAPPAVDFSADKVFGFIPMKVEFTDRSSNMPFSWDWDFGDGGGSSLQNPVHTYEEPGIYTVTLTAANCDGSGTGEKTGFIIVTDNQETGGKDFPYLP